MIIKVAPIGERILGDWHPRLSTRFFGRRAFLTLDFIQFMLDYGWSQCVQQGHGDLCVIHALGVSVEVGSMVNAQGQF